jgi:hypothetical protein
MFAYVSAEPVFSHKLIVIASDDIMLLCALQSRVHEIWSRTFGTTFGSSDALTYSTVRVFSTFPFPSLSQLRSGHECEIYLATRKELLVSEDVGLTEFYGRFHEAHDQSEPIRRLRELHDEMDRAVLRAYGWDDLADEMHPEFLTEETEDDHTYQNRYFWPAEARDRVLARLLALNAERHADEVAAGLAPAKRTRAAEDEDDAQPGLDLD